MGAIGDAFQRIKGDIKSNPGVWIGIGLTAVILIVAYLAYTNSQQGGYAYSLTGQGAGGATTSAGSATVGYPTNQDLLNEIEALQAFLQSDQTPNPPTPSAVTGSGLNIKPPTNPAPSPTGVFGVPGGAATPGPGQQLTPPSSSTGIKGWLGNGGIAQKAH